MRKINYPFLKRYLKVLAQIIGCILIIAGVIFITLLAMGYRPVIIGGTFPDWNAIGALGTWLATLLATFASVFLFNQTNVHKRIDMIAKKEYVYSSLKTVFSWCEYLVELFNEFTFQEFETKSKKDIEHLFNSLNDTISKDLKSDVDILDTAEYIFAEQINKDIIVMLQAISIIHHNFRKISFSAQHLVPDSFKGMNVLEKPISIIKEQLLLILSKKDILLSAVKKEIYLPDFEK